MVSDGDDVLLTYAFGQVESLKFVICNFFFILWIAIIFDGKILLICAVKFILKSKKIFFKKIYINFLLSFLFRAIIYDILKCQNY